MVKLKIREVALSRGIESAYQLQKLGFYPAQAAKLYNHRGAALDLATIDKLCIALECQPGDLFEFVPEQKGE